MSRRVDTIIYVVFDLLTASAAWVLFFLYRRYLIELPSFGERFRIIDGNFVLGAIVIPLFWIGLYTILGTYNDVYRKSRLNEFGKTLLATIIGVLCIFFFLILDDFIPTYKVYYWSLTMLFLLHFSLTFFVRFILLTGIARRLKAGAIQFKTIIIGGGQKALDVFSEISSHKPPLGNFFLGFINPNGASTGFTLEEKLPCLGRLPDLSEVIAENEIEEVIIALDRNEHDQFRNVISALESKNVIIKIIPDMYDIMVGHVKMEQIFGAILIEIYPEIMPYWQKVLKRIIDIVASLCALILLSPLMLFSAIKVRLSSEGPILYKQDRVGKDGIPFTMYKFRSMFLDAEDQGPSLSSENDPRITKWGNVLRKWRIDELPQFWNVVLGDMSLVGPRPERQHFINQIKEKAPHFTHLHKVRPGITSWGQVKFGYAENVDQMIERLKFDILYIENMSLLVDFKIMIYTVLILSQGRGQ